ncbi:hypothetical protein AVV30_gp105 [Vibrio phage phi 1]|uniref:Uncharacterized protein n=1 Tax=Vibrio phage phi 1 TaxID=1589297 RepID=A0A0B5H8P1_9CAUD|nr:hypothetical protein AVV30_gp105 [Vibrio phage phi 1]AJF40763.1 hypothetical protein SBVP1_0105 [Vibrio phage phi 1]
MKLTDTYINNGNVNPKTCIWFRVNSYYLAFPFRSNTAPNQLRVAEGFGYRTWDYWLEDKSILKLTKQEGEELCN